MDYLNISVSSEAYKKLTTEDKLRVVNAKLKDLFANGGKKTVTVVYKGRKKCINKDKIGVFKDLLEREKALEKQIIVNAINNNVVNSSVNSNSIVNASIKSNSDIKNKKENNSKNKLLIFPVMTSLIAGTTNVINKKFLKNKSKKVLSFGKNIVSKIKKINLKNIKNNVVTGNIFNKSNKILKEKTGNVVSFSKKVIHKIGNNKIVQNIKSKTSNINYKKVVRKASAWVCAFALVMTGLLVASRNNNKSKSEGDDFNKISTSQTDPNITDDDISKKDETPGNNEDIGVIENTDEVVETEDTSLDIDELSEQTEEKITFDDVVTINDNSYIYTNAYDASYNTNMYNPYYDGSYDREVQGIVYELNGNIYTVYEDDTNSMQIQQELENAGATAVAVLVTRSDLVSTGEYEGYYNVNSVRVKTR